MRSVVVVNWDPNADREVIERIVVEGIDQLMERLADDPRTGDTDISATLCEPEGVMDKLTLEGRTDLTPEEAVIYCNEQTQKYFGLTMEQFIAKAEAYDEDLADHPMTTHLVMLTGARLKKPFASYDETW